MTTIRGAVLALSILVFWTLFGVFGFMIIEGWGFLNSLYMTVITISTVGFGEVQKMGDAGKVFAIILIVGGWITSFNALARIGQLLFEGGFFDILGNKRRHRKIMELTDHYIVCGYGRMGKGIVEGLREKQLPFVVVDCDASNADHFVNEGILYVIGDATMEETLKDAGIEQAKVLLALLPSDADNLYLSIAAKEVNSDIFLIARAIYEIAEKRLKKSGANLVISPYKVASFHALNAATTLKPGLSLELGTSVYGVPVSLQEVKVGAKSQLAGATVIDSQLKSKYGVLVVGIKKESGEVLINPDPDAVIHSGDILVITGENVNLKSVQDIC